MTLVNKLLVFSPQFQFFLCGRGRGSEGEEAKKGVKAKGGQG